LEFSLKYDDFSLDFLHEIFKHIEPNDIVKFVQEKPTGRYRRKIGFLYELLTNHNLPLPNPINATYADLLDVEKYVTANAIKDGKWKINNNLLGDKNFCPIVRKTAKLVHLLSQSIRDEINQLKNEYSKEIFERATSYLYKKETRSSYAIEKEDPSPDRITRFIDLLRRAGTEPTSSMLKEARLVQLQNEILDPRFAEHSFRNYQNYVGEVLPGLRELVHYICPPPEFVNTLMSGLSNVFIKTSGVPSEIRASIIAFSFVFIHPFGDGNGRLHRFLIHDVLAHDGLVPEGIIIPVSAHLLNNIRDYDNVLEKYSKPLMQRARYNFKDDGDIEVTNSQFLEGYYRYPDLTEQCIYLLEVIHSTVLEDINKELLFLERYDELKSSIQNIVDMPDKDINLVITFLHNNRGKLPKRRREKFNKLTDVEISKMEDAYQQTFEKGY
jgi:hypothetical protein